MGTRPVTVRIAGVLTAAAVVLALAMSGRIVAGTAGAASAPAPDGPPSGVAAVQAGVQPSRAALVDYEREVKPILAENCLECHSQDKRKGGLSLAAYADVLEGGRSGAAVRPGHASTSLLLARIAGRVGDQMPLDGLPLSDAQMATLARWIDQGARATPASPPAPPPWEAPLALTAPAVPAAAWPGWDAPPDRLVSAYLARTGTRQPALVSDALFARRAYLDAWGLLPSPGALQAFVADRSPDKRARLVETLLADEDLYAEGWISFWNDLLRNEDGHSYYSEQNGRKSITGWLMAALATNMRYDRMVAKLLNPADPGDPDGFLVGVNWRGETSAAVTPWMQASQNTAQAFLGVNFKCNACHDSFVSKWTLKDAYGLAAYFSPDPSLQLFRCDVARDEFTGPSFFFPELQRSAASPSLHDRRAAAAAIFTDPRNGRLPRTIVNRLWTRLLGRGIVPSSDEMDGKPWSPELLDWLASDFVSHEYDLKHLIARIMTSRPYQMPSVVREAEPPARDYTFRGPEVRRLTAEQFADAIGTITGEWGVLGGGGQTGASAIAARSSARRVRAQAPQPGRGLAVAAAAAPAPGGGPGAGPRTSSDPATLGIYVREYLNDSSQLTRALGRPMRDQITSTRAVDATTLQALELVNGEILTRWLMRGARRLVGELPPDVLSRFNAAAAGRNLQPRAFDADVTGADRLWIVVSDTGSNAPERVLPVFRHAEFVGPAGSVPLSALTPIDASGLRPDGGVSEERVPVKNRARLVYDVAGRGFTNFRGTFDVENTRAEIGSTLNPQLRFFIFDAEPDMDRLLPPSAELPLPAPPAVSTVTGVVDHIFWSALGRAPAAAERRLAETAVADPARPGRPRADSVADLLWAVLMKPEFQLLY